MNDRDVEAGPGDNQQMELGDESLERPAEAKPIVMPRKAEVSRSDQARRLRPSRTAATGADPKIPASAPLPPAPLLRARGAPTRSAAQAHPIAEPQPAEPADQAYQSAEPGAAPIHLDEPHPLARLRRGASIQGRDRGLGLGRFALPRSGAATVGDRWTRRRTRLRRPSIRGIFGIAGLTATVAVVTALMVTLPSQPLTPAPTGSVYGINWQKAGPAPVARMDFGPYFTTLDNDLLMVGTTGSTTTVWATSNGSIWTQRSNSGSFSIDGRRFVSQGFSDDGQGGLVVVGNSIGSSPTDVVASAWSSLDGTAWTPMSVEAGTGQEMVAGAASGSGAVVTAGNGVAWLSTDGRTWSAQVLPGASTKAGAYTPRAVGSWAGGFVIVGLWDGSGPTRSAAWYSATGRDWKQATTSLAGFDARGIAAVGARIVVVGDDLSEAAPALAASWSSIDGNTWTESTAPTDQSTVGLDGVAAVDGALLAFGAPPASTTATTAAAGPTLPGSTPVPAAAELFWVSENGVDWLPITSTTAPLSHARLAAVGSLVAMIGGSTSGLGVVSGQLVLGPARPPASPSAPPAVYALTVQPGNSPMIADVTKYFTLGPVTTTNDRFDIFVTGPTGTSIYSSPDGSLWSEETGPAGLTASGVTGRPVVLQAVPDGQGGIIAVGKVTNSSGDNGMIWHMNQSGKWQQAQFQDDTPPEFSSVAAGPGGFVASSDKAGGSPIMYSTDGNTWQAGAIAVGNGFALTVATYRYGYVAVGSDPAHGGATTAWTSPDGRTWTIRTDWHLPAMVTALFGMGNSLVAEAVTAAPATPTASPKPSGSAAAKPTPKPTPTPAAPATVSWWWSATGVVWQQSGPVTSGGNMAIVNSQLLVFDAPVNGGNWTAWTTADGKTWRRPTADPISFAGSRSCTIASLGGRVVIVGWDGPGALKDYLGQFAGQ